LKGDAYQFPDEIKIRCPQAEKKGAKIKEPLDEKGRMQKECRLFARWGGMGFENNCAGNDLEG